MFSKLHSVKKHSNQKITIDELYDLIKNNPQKDLIEKIRGVKPKSTEYKQLKLNVNCITPHTIQNGLRNNDIECLTGYLYYDIDNFDTIDEVNDTIKKLNDTFPISLICKSVGGMGISMLIKIDTNYEVNDTNFIDTYQYVRDLLINKGFNIDKYAGGISRKMLISSDKDCIFNKVSLAINKVSLQTFKQSKHLNKSKQIKTNKEVMILQANDTFDVIDFETLIKDIKIETLYTKEINGDFIVEEMDYYRIFIPKIIKDGTKHKLYTRIINALYYINPSITKRQVYSYLYYINNMANPKMNILELKRLVFYICQNIENTGEVRIKPKIKRLHFKKNSKLTKNQKLSMAAQLGAKIKNNKTIILIQEARMECAKRNEIPTQKRICELTNLSIATVKRNWNKQLNDLTDLKVKNQNEQIYEEISEEDFFEERKIIKHKYKGFNDVSIEVKDEDKEIWKKSIETIKNEYGDISEDILSMYMNKEYGWDKYKTNLFYIIYNKKIKTTID
jgi:hypothetical protein